MGRLGKQVPERLRRDRLVALNPPRDQTENRDANFTFTYNLHPYRGDVQGLKQREPFLFEGSAQMLSPVFPESLPTTGPSHQCLQLVSAGHSSVSHNSRAEVGSPSVFPPRHLEGINSSGKDAQRKSGKRGCLPVL